MKSPVVVTGLFFCIFFVILALYFTHGINLYIQDTLSPQMDYTGRWPYCTGRLFFSDPEPEGPL